MLSIADNNRYSAFISLQNDGTHHRIHVLSVISNIGIPNLRHAQGPYRGLLVVDTLGKSFVTCVHEQVHVYVVHEPSTSSRSHCSFNWNQPPTRLFVRSCLDSLQTQGWQTAVNTATSSTSSASGSLRGTVTLCGTPHFVRIHTSDPPNNLYDRKENDIFHDHLCLYSDHVGELLRVIWQYNSIKIRSLNLSLCGIKHNIANSMMPSSLIKMMNLSGRCLQI